TRSVPGSTRSPRSRLATVTATCVMTLTTRATPLIPAFRTSASRTTPPPPLRDRPGGHLPAGQRLQGAAVGRLAERAARALARFRRNLLQRPGEAEQARPQPHQPQAKAGLQPG